MGDALKDVYMHGTWGPRNGALRFKPTEVLEFEGGAANTLANARAILGDKADVIGWMNKDPLRLYRFIDEDIRESYTQIADENCLSLPTVMHQTHVDGIIISDYNKGTVNKPCPYLVPVAPFVIVDSRYRSLHPDYLKLGWSSIWRCTGNEYDIEYARNFDMVIHTDGPGRIYIWRMKTKKPGYFIPWSSEHYVPKIEPVDTCGAGDTFTAMLGAQFLFGCSADSAMHRCISAAQEVCMKKYTAVTTERL
jgi:sugar/nucleoside kinase (ribokinase family)